MANPSQSHPWHLPYATQLPAANSAAPLAYTPSPYPFYLPVRPPSPRQVDPYSPEQQASPGWSDGYSVEGSTTPELEPTGPSSLESHHSPLFFSAPTPQSETSSLGVPVGLDALEVPANSSDRPEHTVNTMIKAALLESPAGKLPSRDIVRAIQARFAFYQDKGNEKNLKSTIRHHLSNTKTFVKVPKDASMRGKGDYWTYDPNGQPAKAAIDVPGSTSRTGGSRRRSPSAGASSPYQRPRRAVHRGTEDTITQRSASTRSGQGVGPIRVSPKVRPSTRLALPDDQIPSNPRPIRQSAGRSTSTRLGLSQHRPSHGLWSPRGPVNSSLPSSPEQPETLLDAPGGLKQRDVADRDGFVHTSFFHPTSYGISTSPSSNISSPLQLPLPQISSSLAENSLLQVAASSQMQPFYTPSSSLLGMDQTSFPPEFNVDQLSQLYLNFDDQTEFPSHGQSFI
ncbi:hypothetical protein FRC04_005913 [Tulasnella sp. 424]|nr:hypothetical protein FRC04_005913 [Tulasnella sp. 424]KAG8976057.1 hypothetical protein FRC05_004689 [Tulasnella sp. 425]